jgi:hypothetical protein
MKGKSSDIDANYTLKCMAYNSEQWFDHIHKISKVKFVLSWARSDSCCDRKVLSYCWPALFFNNVESSCSYTAIKVVTP